MAITGKNKRRQFEVEDTYHNVMLSVDSSEEVDFINWCCEAAVLDVIKDFEYQPESFVLFDKVRYVNSEQKERTLFQDHIYSPDFKIILDPHNKILSKEFKIPFECISQDQFCVFGDVKGTFNRTARSFSVDRKWVWNKFKIYIYELIPQDFFNIAGCPKKSFYTKKTKKCRKPFAHCKTIAQTFSIEDNEKNSA